ncbi:MAG: L,D-transpeptidase family protein [Luteolibacter sp.]
MQIEIPAEARSDLPHPAHPRAAAASQRVRPALESALYQQGLRFGDPVFLRAYKKERLLEVFVRNRDDGKFHLFRSYPVAAASGAPGPKLREGDKQVPEGFYSVSPPAMNSESKFHLSFNLGYPNAFDRHHRRDGSLIMIHGGRASIGCLAMTDPAIEEIYTLCDAAQRGGQRFFRVHIFPFRMTDENLAATHDHPWHDFWRNLRDGHDWFEKHGVPPDARVSPDGTYLFLPATEPKPAL